MDYEKLHKDTITKLQEMVNSGKITVKTACGICADFVPENEDERIRKTLVVFFTDWHKTRSQCWGISVPKILAWLEKRGEQKPLVIPKFRKGDLIRYKTNPDDVKRVDSVMDDHYILDIKGECTHVLFSCQDLWELVEQKPVNVDYISGIRKELLNIEDNAENIDGLTESQWVAIRAAHRLLGEYIDKEQSHSWSEEDENINYSIIDILTKLGFQTQINWFKFLKYRYTWKPSGEQMEALKNACDEHWEPDGLDPLYTLYQDLKKLREE